MFGLVALGGFVVFILSMKLIAKVIHLLINHSYKHKQIEYRPIFWVVTLFSWIILFRNELVDDFRMYRVSKDCGYTELNTVNNLKGIYVELIGYDRTQAPFSDYFLNDYPAIERLNYKGEVIGQRGLKIDHRTFRYGIRSKREFVQSDIVRITDIFMDFDTDEVLAKNIKYEFEKKGIPLRSDMMKLILFIPSLLLELFPQHCERESWMVEQDRLMHVLQTTKTGP